MKTWWGRKSRKNKLEDRGVLKSSPNSSGNCTSYPTAPVSSRKRLGEVKSRKFDDSPGVVGAVSSRSLGSRCSSRVWGVESDGNGGGAGREFHPLPRPLVSPSSGNGFDHQGGGGGGFGLINGGSGSVSSFSSAGSSNDFTPPPPILDQFPQFRGHDEAKISLRSRSPGPGPGPGSRVTMTSSSHHSQMPHSSSSPLLPQSRVESPMSKTEDGRSQYHPLPLPPSSPTSPSVMYNMRTSLAAENGNISPKSWQRGRLLGRGTFADVYLGFNSDKGRLCAIKEVKLISDDKNSRECLKQLNQQTNLHTYL